EDYLADLRDAADCTATSCERFTWSSLPGDCEGKVLESSGECAYRSGGSPVISNVVRSVSTSDRFDRIGAPANVVTDEYGYHDGYYEGIEHEFRGFGAADVRAIGDSSHPTSTARTLFHQARRPSEIAADRLIENPDEALKGAIYLTEAYDENGAYLSTVHHTFTVRPLHI